MGNITPRNGWIGESETILNITYWPSWYDNTIIMTHDIIYLGTGFD